MNEQFQALADQAGIQMFEDRAFGWSVIAGTDHNVQQFAEAIVRECMWKIMQRQEEAIDDNWHVDEAMSAAISDISEHFGVEE